MAQFKRPLTPIEHWHEVIGNPPLADAILDRLIHNAYKITLKGESMRKKKIHGYDRIRDVTLPTRDRRYAPIRDQ